MATYSKSALSDKSAELDSNLSPAVRALMQQYEQAHSRGQEDEEEPETLPRIVYVSRTHSQLSQFVAELKKTSFGHVDVIDAENQPIRTISLGSGGRCASTKRCSESEGTEGPRP